MAALAILPVGVASDGPAALELSGRRPYELALLGKVRGMGGVQLYGQLKRVQADTVGVLVMALRATTVNAGSGPASGKSFPSRRSSAAGFRSSRRSPGRPDALARKCRAHGRTAGRCPFLLCQAGRDHASAQPGVCRASNVPSPGVD
jgi:hypothetical protein